MIRYLIKTKDGYYIGDKHLVGDRKDAARFTATQIDRVAKYGVIMGQDFKHNCRVILA